MRSKGIVKRTNIEQPFLRNTQQSLSFITLSQSKGVQQIEKRGKYVYFPIMSCSKTANISPMRIASQIQKIYHKSIPTTGQAEQIWIRYLEGLIPTLYIMPESNS